MGKEAARLGDKAKCMADKHGTQVCPRQVIGPAVQGSPDVFINNKPAVRKGDAGIHMVCMGPNTWEVKSGSKSVNINGEQAARKGDPTKHCGGNGKIVEGSKNVLFGD